jgi:CheY-like chemotaxis protein
MTQKISSILLIDDNPDDNFYNRLIIEEAGVANTVYEVGSGEEALQFLKKEGKYAEIPLAHPQLIFLDINMPGMNGFEFLEAYKKLEDQPEDRVVVMMLTTSTNPADKQEAKKLQVDEFTVKPLTENRLLDIVDNYFKR